MATPGSQPLTEAGLRQCRGRVYCLTAQPCTGDAPEYTDRGRATWQRLTAGILSPRRTQLVCQLTQSSSGPEHRVERNCQLDAKRLRARTASVAVALLGTRRGVLCTGVEVHWVCCGNSIRSSCSSVVHIGYAEVRYSHHEKCQHPTCQGIRTRDRVQSQNGCGSETRRPCTGTPRARTPPE